VLIGIFVVGVPLTLVVARMSGYHLHRRNIVSTIDGFNTLLLVRIRHDDDRLLGHVTIVIFNI